MARASVSTLMALRLERRCTGDYRASRRPALPVGHLPCVPRGEAWAEYVAGLRNVRFIHAVARSSQKTARQRPTKRVVQDNLPAAISGAVANHRSAPQSLVTSMVAGPGDDLRTSFDSLGRSLALLARPPRANPGARSPVRRA